jgi:hypothetical protein
MRELVAAAVIIAALMAPMAAQASDAVAANPKLPMAGRTEPLLPKNAIPEARKSYACMLGRAAGTALSMLLGSGAAWDALADALSGLPPSAEQRAFCALGEALAPHVSAAAERQAEAAQELMVAGSAQIGQAWASLRDATRDTGADLTRLCEASSSCTSLRDGMAQAWSRLLPMR